MARGLNIWANKKIRGYATMNHEVPNTPHHAEEAYRFEANHRLDSITELLEAIKELGASYGRSVESERNDTYSNFAIFTDANREDDEAVAGRLELRLMREVIGALELAGQTQDVDACQLEDRLSRMMDEDGCDVIGEVGAEQDHTLKLSQSA
jgi:hypothetical protein